MPDASRPASIEISGAIREIDASAWDLCAGVEQPSLRHAFFAALESSGSATQRHGWTPRHLLARDGGGALIGCAPLYLKTHSFGEYVFDWSWADAYQRAGGRYYPKLQCAVPFTPITGRRLLLRPDASAETAGLLIEALSALAAETRVSSAHVTFPTGDEAAAFEGRGYLRRLGFQYHWFNRGYERFDDFLETLSARKRKAIRKERRTVRDEAPPIRMLRGREIAERHWDALHRFYIDTVDRKGANVYLTRDFFFLLGETMAEQVALSVCEKPGGEIVAAALHLVGPDALFGRYWGCNENFRNLHFEACYYCAIELAISLGLSRVEAGAQGEHKIQRGYLPVATHSAHLILDAEFRRAVARFLAAEREVVAQEIAALSALGPYKREDAE